MRYLGNKGILLQLTRQANCHFSKEEMIRKIKLFFYKLCLREVEYKIGKGEKGYDLAYRLFRFKVNQLSTKQTVAGADEK